MRSVLISPSCAFSPDMAAALAGGSTGSELPFAAAAAVVFPLQPRAMDFRPGEAGALAFTAARAATAAASFKAAAAAGRTEVWTYRTKILN